MKPIQPHLDVSCAIIEKDGLILAAQRGEAMNLPLKWEFSGDRVGPHENAVTCLQREIREELGGASLGVWKGRSERGAVNQCR